MKVVACVLLVIGGKFEKSAMEWGKMREKHIEEQLIEAVNRRKGLALKLYSPSYVGVPDRLVLIAFGRVGFVEVKAPGRKPRPIQLKRHEELRRLGFKVYVLDGREQIEGILNGIEGGSEDGIQAA